MTHRIERFTSTLKHSLADILLNDAGNPHLKFVVITDILVNPDLKKARVFITVPGNAGDASTGDSIDTVIRQLDHAKGYIKKILAQKMYLRYVPELIFIPAPTFNAIDATDATDAVDNFQPGIRLSDPDR
ncbi:MAG: ribosome-binding factor [Acidobacteriota bacterium]|nr:ribosome-binding factor [Acidobacteriota bacterium]